MMQTQGIFTTWRMMNDRNHNPAIGTEKFLLYVPYPAEI
jgi:hypothetical protein